LHRKKIITITIILTISLGFLLKPSEVESLPNISHTNILQDSVDRSSWSWQEMEVVSIDAIINSRYPEIAIDSKNNVHIVWEEWTGGYDIHYRMWNYQTKSWSATENIAPLSGVAERPSIAIDKNDNVHVVWNDDNNYYGTTGTDWDIVYRMKAADSDTWTDIEVVSTESTDHSVYPSIDVDGSGNLHVVWYDGTDYLGCGTDADVFYKKWHSASSSWGTAEVVSTESTDHSSIAEVCVTDDEHVFVAWSDDTDYDSCGVDRDIFFKRRSPSGIWSSTEVISWLATAQSEYVDIDCEDNGRIHIVWNDYTDMKDSGSDIDVFYVLYDPNLSTWLEPEVVSQVSTMSSSQATINIDVEGDIHILWHDTVPYGGCGSDYDVLYIRKDSSTNTWSSTSVVSAESNGNSLYPEFKTDEFGYLHAIWVDNMDYLGAGTDLDIFYKKYVGPPGKPILSSIIPNPSPLGNITLEWNDVIGAEEYSIYNSSSYITDISELVPITISENSFVDSITIPGVYYYAIVASNEWGDSDLSNVESVEILVSTDPPGFFQSLRLGEIVVLAAILGGFQLILTIITYTLLKSRTTSNNLPKKKK